MKHLAFVVAVVVLCSCGNEAARPPRVPSQRRDALSQGVVISEVYGGGQSTGAAYRYDFVELLNRGTTAVDVSNWSAGPASPGAHGHAGQRGRGAAGA